MFTSCLNPTSVYNRTLGQTITVSCGRCEYCREQRRKVWARRLELHAKSSGFILFFTLTYDNKFLPKVYYNEKGITTHFVHSKERLVFNRHSGTYHINQEIIKDDELYSGIDVFRRDEFLSTVVPPHYVIGRDSVTREPIYSKENSFAIAYGKDFTDFIKRCRRNLSYYYSGTSFDPSFTYFGVSEYGPKTFRPHFHGLLFFRTSPPDLVTLLSILSKSWSKSPDNKVGREFQPVTSKTASAKYVSKYVCKDTTLPSVLLTSEFCTHSYKSISIPLGSQSLDLPRVFAAFSKGTLLYDALYYDKIEHKTVSYKCSYPDCAWQRFFPKLLGRRLLSVSLMREIFERIFKYTNSGCIPNLIKEFPLKYPLGKLEELFDPCLIEESVLRYEGFDSPFGFPNIESFEIDSESFLDENVTNFNKSRGDLSCIHHRSPLHKLTYSYFLFYLLRHDLDFYLFGIPQNYTFCRKVFNNFKRYKFLNTSEKYLHAYLRYETIKFTDGLKYLHEYFNQLPTAYEFGSIYSDFYNGLCNELSCYTENQVSHLDMILSNFNLGISNFYDAKGNKIIFDYAFARDNDAFKLQLKEQSYSVASSHNEFIYNDI